MVRLDVARKLFALDGAAEDVDRLCGLSTTVDDAVDAELVVQDRLERAADAAKVDLPFPLFVKPVAEGTAKGIRAESKVKDKRALEAECARVIEACRQPALVETFLPGREVTVGITGTGDNAVAVATLEVILRPAAEADSYTYKNKEYCEDLCEYVLAKGEGSPFYEQSLYKHGWSLFKQQLYEDSLASFFRLLDRQLGTDNSASGDRDPAARSGGAAPRRGARGDRRRRDLRGDPARRGQSTLIRSTLAPAG